MQKLSVDIYAQKNQAVQDAYDVLVANICSCDPRPKTLCVTGGAPGVGKTTTSINLAVSLVMAGYSALLIDGDIRKISKHKRLGADNLLGLSDFLTGSMKIDDAITYTNMDNLKIMTCGYMISLNPLGILYSKKFDYLIEETVKKYDFVIFDSSSLGANVDSSVIASKTDGVLIVVEANNSSKALERDIAKLNSMGANIIGTVLNKMPKREYKNYMNFYNYKYKSSRSAKRTK